MKATWPISATLLVMALLRVHGYGIGYYISEKERQELDENPLPRTISPSNYKLKLNPKINEGYFNGSVNISVMCHEPTDTITLHAHKNLSIRDSQISIVGSSDIQIIEVTRNETLDTLTIKLSEELHKGASYDLCIEFGSEFKTNIQSYMPDRNGGFFIQSYQSTDSSYVGTITYPNFARRVFPCFDEPIFKATFEISVAHPSNMTALSVMPLNYTEFSDEEDIVWDHFSQTGPIPTFSINIIVSELESLEPKIISSPEGMYEMRIYYQKNHNVRNMEEDTALIPARLQFIQEFLQVSHPIPKLDIVALSNFYMYNMQPNSLGLVIMEEYSVNDNVKDMQIALMSQWFNSLITPPDWKSFNISYLLTSFLVSTVTKYVTDKNTPTIEPNQYQYQYEQFASDFNRTDYEDYDMYYKSRGEWFIEMLRISLGSKALQTALRNVIRNNMYGTYTEADLWLEMTQQGWNEQTLPTTLTVGEIADSWLNNKLYRYPVLTITRNYQDNFAKLQQHVFTTDLSRNLTQEEKQHLWWIPVSFLTPQNLDPSAVKEVTWMGDRQLTVANLPDSKSFIIANPTDTGMFLVNYDENNWQMISQFLVDSISEIPVVTRMKLLNDAFLLAKGGELNYTTALNMMQFLHNEKNYKVWTSMFTTLDYMDNFYAFTSVDDKLNTYFRELLKPVMDTLKVEPNYQSDPEYSNFYYFAKTRYGKLGNQKDIDEAHKSVNETMPTTTIKDEISGLNLFCPVFMTNISDDWIDQVEKLDMRMMQSYDARSFLEKSFAKCPGYTNLINRILENFLNEDAVFSSSRWFRLLSLMTGSQPARKLSSNYFFENYKELKKKFYFMEDMWTSFVQQVADSITTEDAMKRLQNFYKEQKPKLGYIEPILETSINNLINKIEWIKRNIPDIEYFLEHKLPTQQ